MTTRIAKIEQYIPADGSPVFQIFEELQANGQTVRLDPRNPTADELTDAADQFAAAQQARIAELESQLETLTAERDSLLGQVPTPIGPRQITPEDFLTRFSPADIVAIDQSQDPRVVIAKVTLQTRSSLIDLDSQILTDLIDGLIAGGIQIDDDERAKIFA